ncbi:hypothetical protein [Bacterioplanoides pacificum]|uniref:Uncharacterized protein n=1 Tax=Bacterioplanoides pacificum TaxID=1171596 RepID=A0ABV7VPX2_9GAMM
MTEKSPVPTSLQVQAQIDQALAESGLAEQHVERQPLPLFYSLLQEWLSCQHLPQPEPGAAAWPQQAEQLLQQLSAREVSESLRMMVEETQQLSRAHGCLTIWNQRELDNRLRDMIREVEQQERCRELARSRRADTSRPGEY